VVIRPMRHCSFFEDDFIRDEITASRGLSESFRAAMTLATIVSIPPAIFKQYFKVEIRALATARFCASHLCC
jgi:hypothetical protein